MNLEKLMNCAVTDYEYKKILELVRWSDGFKCPRCACSKGYWIKTRSLMECANCKKQTSATSGTALHRIRNIGAWMKAISYFLEDNSLSARQLCSILRISYESAWTMLHKIRVTLCVFIENKGVQLFIPCDQAGKGLFKRSNELGKPTLFKAPKKKSKVIDRFIQFLLVVFRGVSRKYAQAYAIEYSFWSIKPSISLNDLLIGFIRGEAISGAQIKSYSSADPLLIKVRSG